MTEQLKYWRLHSKELMKKYKIEKVTFEMIKEIYRKENFNKIL